MDVYDTNVWIFVLHDPDSQAGELVQEAIYGDRHVLVSGYVYQEVIRNIGDGIDRPESEEIQNAFATFVEESKSIVGPNDDRIKGVDIALVKQIVGDCSVAGAQPPDSAPHPLTTPF